MSESTPQVVNTILNRAAAGGFHLPDTVLERYARAAAVDGDTRLLRTLLKRDDLEHLTEELAPRPTPGEQAKRIAQGDPDRTVRILERDQRLRVREAAARKSGLPAEVRNRLALDPHPRVVLAAADIDVHLLTSEARHRIVEVVREAASDGQRGSERLLSLLEPFAAEMLELGSISVEALSHLAPPEQLELHPEYYAQVAESAVSAPSRWAENACERLIDGMVAGHDAAITKIRYLTSDASPLSTGSATRRKLARMLAVFDTLGGWNPQSARTLDADATCKLIEKAGLLARRHDRRLIAVTEALCANPKLPTATAVELLTASAPMLAGRMTAMIEAGIDDPIVEMMHSDELAVATVNEAVRTAARRARVSDRVRDAVAQRVLLRLDGYAQELPASIVRELNLLSRLTAAPWKPLAAAAAGDGPLASEIIRIVDDRLPSADGFETFSALAESFEGTFGDLLDATAALHPDTA